MYSTSKVPTRNAEERPATNPYRDDEHRMMPKTSDKIFFLVQNSVASQVIDWADVMAIRRRAKTNKREKATHSFEHCFDQARAPRKCWTLTVVKQKHEAPGERREDRDVLALDHEVVEDLPGSDGPAPGLPGPLTKILLDHTSRSRT